MGSNQLAAHGIAVEDFAHDSSTWKKTSKTSSEVINLTWQQSKPKSTLQMSNEVYRKLTPETFFKDAPQYTGRFSKFDALGFPTHDANLEELSKTETKKLRKKLTKFLASFQRP